MNRKANKALESNVIYYNIQVTGRHVDVTDFMKEYAIEKVSKIERFIDRIIDVNIIMDIQKLDHRVEIILKVGNLNITSQASTTDMYVSIDQAVDKLEKRVLRYKSRLQDHHARGHADLNMAVNVVSPLEIEDEFDFEAEPVDSAIRFKPHQIVKKETLPIKTLTHDEAVIKMELSSDAFLLFKDERDQKLKLIYRLKDENYGVIEPSC